MTTRSGAPVDFISQASFASGITLPNDCLGHEEFARSVLRSIRFLPSGSVIAIEGAWGLGKTDILTRIALRTNQKPEPAGLAAGAIWLNPWQYGTPDLLSPAVLALLERMTPSGGSPPDALRKAAETVIKAGIGFGLKAAAVTIPGGKIFEAAADDARELLAGLFEARGIEKAQRPDPDAVSVMAQRFAELVDAVLAAEGYDADAKLLLCIDDLDRCLPHRQVAFLEAMRFLVSAGARVTVVIAFDPRLARQSVMAHYGTNVVDPDLYLDKMFSVRMRLPAISDERLVQLLDHYLGQTVRGSRNPVSLRELLEARLGRLFDEMTPIVTRSLIMPEFRNARLLKRVFDKLALLSLSDTPEQSLDIPADRRWLVMLWLALIERRPELRAALHVDVTEHKERFEHIFRSYTYMYEKELPNDREMLQMRTYMKSLGLPDFDDAADLISAFQIIGFNSSSFATGSGQAAEVFFACDRYFTDAGL